MEFDVALLGIVFGLVVLANRLVAALITPIFEKYGLEKFWLTYIAWVVSGLLVWLTGINLFAAYIPYDIVGKILTAVVAGGGANILHDLSDQQAKMTIFELSGIDNGASAILKGDGVGEPVGILRHEDVVEEEVDKG